MVRTRPSVTKGNLNPVKRMATPAYCKQQLGEVLKKLITTHGTGHAFDLGEYRHIPSTNGVRGLGLLAIEHILVALLEVTPFALIKYSDLKNHLKSLCVAFPDMKSKKESEETWSTDVATELNTALSHLRRLKN